MVSTKCMEITAESSGGLLAYDATAEWTLHGFAWFIMTFDVTDLL